VRALLALDILLAVVAVVSALFWPSASEAQATFTIHKVDAAAWSPQRRNEPFFMLLIGNDARAGLEGIRGDALHLVGVNPAAGSATILNIPRDTWANIPGFGSAKINDGYRLGGLQTQVQAVAGLTGVNFAFVVTTNFDGFQAMIEEMGGLHVDVPYDMFDRNSGADFQAGRRHMLGPGALSYARNRHIPGGDIARTEHQGQLLVGGLERAREVVRSPFETMRMLSIISRHTHYEGVDLRDMYTLVSLGVSIDPANVRNVTMPASVGQVGPASVVFAAPGSQELFADFRDDALLQTH
jgi:LCP family protein required for cell wall assembly